MRRGREQTDCSICGGGQLYLTIDGQGVSMRRRWLFLFKWGGKRREMDLGGFPAVSLAEARKARDDAERMVREGRDPIAARDLARDQQATQPTFGSVADEWIATKESQWRHEKHRWRWRHTLEVYAAPLGARPVDEVDTAAILEALIPLWSEKPETASRLRGRIEAVLDAAKAQGSDRAKIRRHGADTRTTAPPIVKSSIGSPESAV